MMRKGLRGKIALLTLSLSILGFAFFLPLYTSAFTNSDFTRCDACHVQVGDELSRTVYHKSLKCTSCHNVTDFAPDLYTHNATTYECNYCHDNTNASQFTNDAHSNFQNASVNSSIFAGRNEMCVSCHTAIDLEIEWHSRKSMDMTILSRKGFWELQFSVSGDTKNTTYSNYTDYLNRTNWSRTSNP